MEEGGLTGEGEGGGKESPLARHTSENPGLYPPEHSETMGGAKKKNREEGPCATKTLPGGEGRINQSIISTQFPGAKKRRKRTRARKGRPLGPQKGRTSSKKCVKGWRQEGKSEREKTRAGARGVASLAGDTKLRNKRQRNPSVSPANAGY